MLLLTLSAAAALAAAPVDVAARRADLLRRRAAIDAALAALDAPAPAPSPDAAPPPAPARDIVVTAQPTPPSARGAGETDTTVTAASFRDTPATTVADIVRLAPGVTVIGGNGPRDIGVSIRGSNARNSFGARNIVVFEDGFPVTQPDGLARFDLTDPHAYAAVDVVRGPSSARYGGYAVEGALDFHTRTGADIQGLELGLDGGTAAYLNGYATLGHAGERYDYALFGSYVRGAGTTGHTGYGTGTINARASVTLSDRDTVTGKLIFNQGVFHLSTRLSFDQYRLNPYQQGCTVAAGAAPGCGTIAVLANGVNGPRIAQTAAEADLLRDDRRTIVGLRWDHDLAADTVWRTQAVFDSRVVNQPTSANPFKGTLDSYAVSSTVTRQAPLLGMDGTSVVGISYATLDNQSYTFNKTPAGRDGFGALQQTVFGDIRTVRLNARQELALTSALQLVLGVGAERSVIAVRQTGYAYPLAAPAVVSVIPARRTFRNVAPEAALAWTVDPALRLHARIATGYGIPQAGQLFVTPAGVPGNNTTLQTQRNLGVDVGAELTLGRALTAELTVYQEWFRNEQVTQAAGVNLLAYTANVPRSLHRGVEAGVTWRPLSGGYLQASYSYNDQQYTRYVERLVTSGVAAAFDRAGNAIPGVIPSFANGRIGYDASGGALAGLGGFVELTYRGRYAIDNANLLYVPAATLVNLNVHYDPPVRTGWLAHLRLFAAIQNVGDVTYVGSAAPIADAVDAAGGQASAAVLRATTGALYAGQPRTFVAGLRRSF